MGGRAWAAAEDRALRELWGEASERRLRAALRGRTWRAIRHRAKVVLRLPGGVPQGHVHIKAAARAAGFSWCAMMGVLRWAGVATRVSYSKPGHVRQGRRVGLRYVEADAARDAAARWCACESISQAARRVGLSNAFLGVVLRRAGVLTPAAFYGHRVGYRLAPAVVDRVLAAHRAGRERKRAA